MSGPEPSSRELLELARGVCTAREVEALEWWARGAGYRRIGLILGVWPPRARDRVQRALRKLERAAR